METKQLKELLLLSLEAERGGVEVYEAALESAVNDELKEEWEKYHQETQRHVEIMAEVLATMKIDPGEKSPGRGIVHDLGASLVKAMKTAQKAGDPVAAELVAC